MLAGPRFRIYGNTDIIGVELAGALKNVVAIAAGLSAGLGFGSNTLSMLITRGLAEISRLGEVLGAERLTFKGLAGIGDLIATCSSTLSRNHTVGRRLAEGETLEEIVTSLGMVAEGVNTTRGVHLHASRLGVEMPIAEGMYRLLYEGLKPGDVLEGLMSRRSVYETTHETIHESSLASSSILEHAAAASYREACRGDE